FMPYALSSFGLGDFTNDDLMKYTAGIQAGISVGFKTYVRQVSGSSTPKDLPAMMELLYMTFTNLNFSQEEFAALQNTYVGLCRNQESDPQYVFAKRMNQTLMKSPKDRGLSVEAIQNASRERIISFAREMLANAADYDFCFVGNVDVDSLRPLVEQYVASLPGDPATARRSVSLDPEIGLRGGTRTNESSFKMSTPQTWAAILDFGDVEYTAKNQRLASIAGQILSKRLIDIVREKEGAVYSISASGIVDRLHNNPLIIQTAFPMKPEMKDKVLEIIAGEIKGMESNVTQEELNTVKEYLVKSFNASLEKNRDWLSAITGYQINGVDTFNPSLEIIQSITVDDVQRFMSDLNAQGNYRVVILSPETETDEE
ncbi:MAG: insulinase family protein, partial [Bacteroidales bacterium]|nr:insulinase family protein [Bacteroidales bacterium]